ncbi:MAG: enoyl-acyl carrier protein reductase FabMG [Bdellovibrionia bacterium]
MNFNPIRNKPNLAPYSQGDVLVLFGELFNRGYANGLVDEAIKRGMTIIQTTVGRRDKDGNLRNLTAEEIPQGPFINVALEAGFDMEKADNGFSPVDQLKDIKLSDWENATLDFTAIEQSRQKGVARFRSQVADYLKQLEPHLPAGKKVLFAHLMAGGVPRAKIVMPLMNRAFKGSGERYLASDKFWNSPIGKLCAISFNEVTANTYRHLIDLSSDLRQKITASGGHVSYLAYGYHGTDIFFNGEYRWQTYTPYLQGWAKMELEKISAEFHGKGVASCVYNCPEILTNSSSIFQGVEVSLYPLMVALSREANSSSSAATQKILADCKALLKDEVSLEQIEKIAAAFFMDSEIKKHCQFDLWPQHSSQLQLEKLLAISEELYKLHKDEKLLLTSVLSEVVFKSCGYVMLNDSYSPQQPVAWIGHDIVAKCVDVTW